VERFYCTLSASLRSAALPEGEPLGICWRLVVAGG